MTGIRSTIHPLWEQMPLQLKSSLTEERRETVTASPFADIFDVAIETVLGRDARPVSDIFRSAVEAVKETDAEKVQMEYLMATGQLDNPALLTIAETKAQMSVELLVQLRNKALDAYNELMRISL